MRSVLATGTLAKLICGAELLNRRGLIWRRARLVAVVAALMLHLSIEAMMPVSTFGLQMLVALLVFLPKPSAQGRLEKADTSATKASGLSPATL